MNFSYRLAEAGGRGDNGDRSCLGSLRLVQKRAHDQLCVGDHTSRPQAVDGRRLLSTDDFIARSFPAKSHMSDLPPWANTSTLLFAPGQNDNLGSEYAGNQCFGCNSELGGACELPILNHRVGLLPPLPRYSGSTRFAGLLDSGTISAQHLNIFEANRRLDGKFNKGMYPAYGAYNNPKETRLDSCQFFPACGSYRRNEANIDLGVENMRLVCSGKEFNRSPTDTTFQKESGKFTLMGEVVEKSTGTPSSAGHEYKQQHEKMITLATWYDANLASLSSASETGNLIFQSFGSDHGISPAVFPTGSNRKSYPNYGPSRFASSTDQCGTTSSILNGSSPRSISELLCVSNTIGSEPSAYVNSASSNVASKTGTVKRKKKDNGNVFPANVKSLLSTGIFDGVPVKYVSWDRTKNVRGTIQGTDYLCWCEDCNQKKLVNAYQLEQHAGTKSKHPNDHIYFLNGKSIYGVVQELKNTPSDKLLEVIPTITGCGINEANLSKWKGSFQAARRELQRIFGCDPEEPLSS